MIESVIASPHHYYVFFINSPKLRSLKAVAALFDDPADFEVKKFSDDKSSSYCHLQLGFEQAYGSPALLEANKRKIRGKNIYWYDIYIGKFEISGTEYYFVCYPYAKLAKVLERILHEKSIIMTFYKPNVEKVLDYMRSRQNNRNTKEELGGLLVDITKFTAEVDEDNANRLNLSGTNPLNSVVFKKLKGDPEITISTVSLKLNCKLQRKSLKKDDVISFHELDLSFDRIGNYRFWLRKDGQDSTLFTVPAAFRFLTEITPLSESAFAPKYTLLENE